MAELDLVASDLSSRPGVDYTYESDNGLARSWLDHIICSHDASALISGIQSVHSSLILSDHYPLLFVLNVLYLPIRRAFPVTPALTGLELPLLTFRITVICFPNLLFHFLPQLQIVCLPTAHITWML